MNENVIQFPTKTEYQKLSTLELKRLWDGFNGDEFDAIEKVHAELNDRGEGKYCAV